MALLLCLPLSTLIADEVRPAYLGLSLQSKAATMCCGNNPSKCSPIDPAFIGCELRESAPPEVTGSALIKRWFTACDLSTARIEITGLRTSITDVMVRHIPLNGEAENYIVLPAEPVLTLGGDEADSIGYLMIGVEHLVGGIDHVLFVIGLVLFISSPWMLLKTITAFTVAHSITLAHDSGYRLAAQAPVEAVIALSIVFLAESCLTGRQTIHSRSVPGLWPSFSVSYTAQGLLACCGKSATRGCLIHRLLLFNVGELGQLFVVLVLISTLWLWRKSAKPLSRPQLIYLIAATPWARGPYWTITAPLVILLIDSFNSIKGSMKKTILALATTFVWAVPSVPLKRRSRPHWNHPTWRCDRNSGHLCPRPLTDHECRRRHHSVRAWISLCSPSKTS